MALAAMMSLDFPWNPLPPPPPHQTEPSAEAETESDGPFLSHLIFTLPPHTLTCKLVFILLLSQAVKSVSSEHLSKIKARPPFKCTVCTRQPGRQVGLQRICICNSKYALALRPKNVSLPSSWVWPDP